MLKGSIVALITPFEGENLSEDTYIKLINYHLVMEIVTIVLHQMPLVILLVVLVLEQVIWVSSMLV